MRSPFLNSAVETCMALLAFPPEARAQGRFQAAPRLRVVGILSQQSGEDLRRFLGQALLQAEAAEGNGDVGVVAQDAREPRGLAPAPRLGAQEAEQHAGRPVVAIERHHLLEVTDGGVDVTALARQVGHEPVPLDVPGLELEQRPCLARGGVEIALVGQRPGQGQSARGIARMAREPLPPAGGGGRRQPRAPVEVRELREDGRGGLALEPFLLATDRGCQRGVVNRGRSQHRRTPWRLSRGRRPRQRAEGASRPSSTARTSSRGMPWSTRKAPISVASTNGTRPSRDFLSWLMAARTASTSVSGAWTGRPSRSSRRSWRATVSPAASPLRSASLASPTMPIDTASPCVQRPYPLAASRAWPMVCP